jgi:Uma2 family endonuclease
MAQLGGAGAMMQREPLPSIRRAEHDMDMLSRERVGEAMLSPADLTLRRGTISQPDIFVPPHAEADRAKQWSEIKHLLLAVEVLSPSTARYDRGGKRSHYQRAGVAEYWIVDLEGRLVERWRPGDQRPNSR